MNTHHEADGGRTAAQRRALEREVPRYSGDPGKRIINPENFMLPDMGDYYGSALEYSYAKEYKKAMKNKEGDAYRFAFYAENPPTDSLGYDENKRVYSLLGTPDISEETFQRGGFDADTLYFPLSSLEEGDRPGIQVGDAVFESFADYAVRGDFGRNDPNNETHNRLGVRFLGVDAHEVAKWGTNSYDPETANVLYQTFQASALTDFRRQGGSHIYQAKSFAQKEAIDFVSFDRGGKWHEVQGVERDIESGRETVTFLITPDGNTEEETELGIAQTRTLQALLQNATDVKLVIDMVTLEKSRDFYPTRIFYERYEDGAMNQVRRILNSIVDNNRYVETGFNFLGMDPYKRYLGEVYAKVPVSSLPGAEALETSINEEMVWVNTAKYLIAHHPEMEVWPNYTNEPMRESVFGLVSNAFRLYSYSYKDRKYYDQIFDLHNEFDDRRGIQQEILGKDFEQLKEWTVILGDSVFMVPPTSIRSMTRTQTERLPVMRASGSMAKGSPKSQQSIELTLFFNKREGINGYPVQRRLPNGELVTYYMNGLRSLIAMFKMAPFLPVENAHINEILNTEAVTLRDLQITTMPDYPESIAATLVLERFEYRVYMPELPVDLKRQEEDLFYNPFAAAINFEVLRWHYQRALQRGELAKRYAFNTAEHVRIAQSGKLALKPAEFKDPGINFYIPNENQLNILKQLKIASRRHALDSRPKLSDEGVTVAGHMNSLNGAIAEFVESDITRREIASINKLISDGEHEIPSLGVHWVLEAAKEHLEALENHLNATLARHNAGRFRKTYQIKEDLTHMHLWWEIYPETGGMHLGEEDLSSLRAIAIQQQDDREEPYKNNAIRLQFSASITNPLANEDIEQFGISPNLRYDGQTSDAYFLYAIRNIAEGTHLDDEYEKMKDDIDRLTPESIEYVDYLLPDARVQTLACNMSNILSEINLNGINGYAPQFMGQGDMMIEVNIETTDHLTAFQLQQLPDLSARLVREYRDVLPAWPLRIDSEITGLLGIYDVIIESVQVNTVPNQPGLYQISMNLMSIDKTLRNRETLDQINTDEFVELRSIKGRSATEERDYFNLKEDLKRVPLYPDLELPTYGELKDRGFYFISHQKASDDNYVDPDFYFIYGHIMSSEVFRESIIESFSEEYDDSTYTMNDQVGGEMEIMPDERHGFREHSTNAITDRFWSQAISDAEIVEKVKSESIAKAMERKETRLEKIYQSMYDRLLNTYHDQSWDITKDIKVLFADPRDLVDSEVDENVDSALFKEYKSAARRIRKGIKELTPATVDHNIRHIVIHTHEDMKQLHQYVNSQYWDSIADAVKSTVNEGRYDENAEPETAKRVGAYHVPLVDYITYRTVTGNYPNRESALYGKYFLDPAVSERPRSQEYLHELFYAIRDRERIGRQMTCRQILLMYAIMVEQKIFPSSYIETVEQYAKNADDIKMSFTMIQRTGRGRDASGNTAATEILTPAEQDQVNNFKELLDGLEESTEAIQKGNVYASALLYVMAAGSHENYTTLHHLYYHQKFDHLKKLMQIVNSEGYTLDAYPDEFSYLFRQFNQSLGKEKLLDLREFGTATPNLFDVMSRMVLEQVYLEAGDNPKAFIPHSFYDMIVNDKRGRMVRAFPTYYMLMVDEGRQIGRFRLFDNFYNVSAIHEIQVNKSRKIAADTATIVMSNMFNTYTEDDEDIKENYDYDLKDVLGSFFRTRAFAMREYQRRRKKAPIDRVRLQPGIRLNLRVGYGSDASTLPIVFNGTVAEIDTGSAVTMVAQGDGIELLNPIMFDQGAEQVENQDAFFSFFHNLFTNAATPKEILTALLTTRGGWLKKAIREQFDGRFFNDNPFGISHFGDPDHQFIFNGGEPVQNIYEAVDAPSWGKGAEGTLTAQYASNTPPKLSTPIYGKTAWDLLHICGSVSPDFVVGVTPFGLRSTIFHGAPRYYYAWDYQKSEGGTVYERRKPYQQYKIYTSFTDIIANNIKASEDLMHTAAIGLYQRNKTFGKSMQKVGPLWASFDIFPEKQKTMTIDTQLDFKGIPIINRVPVVNRLTDLLANDEGALQSGYRVAWRMTAHALKEAMKEMYQGEVIVLGDPTVKPHDRMFLNDIYENMSGQCLVEGVTHTISHETGFVSSVYADAVATVDDRHELAVQTMAGNVAAKGMAATTGLIGLTTALAGKDLAHYPLLKAGKMASSSTMKTIGRGISILKSGAGKHTARRKMSASILKGVRKVRTQKNVALAKISGPAAFGGLGNLVALSAEVAIIYAVTRYAYEMIERRMENYKVLHVFPMRKDGRVMTAGLNGSAGLVYGCPSYEDPGLMGKLFSRLFLYKESPEGSKAYLSNALRFLFVSDNMRKIAESYQNDTFDENEEMAYSALLNRSTQEVEKVSAYYASILKPRMHLQQASTAQYDLVIRDLYFLNDASERLGVVEKHPTIERYVNRNNRLDKFIIAHHGEYDEKHTTHCNILGKELEVPYYKVAVNNVITHDLPMLHRDALTILAEITDRYFERTPGADLVFKSGLRIGANSHAATGLVYVLDTENPDHLKGVLDDMVKEKEELIGDFLFFDYGKNKDGFFIRVHPEHMY